VGSDWFLENIMVVGTASVGVAEVKGWREVELGVYVGWGGGCSEVKWTGNMKRLSGAERWKVKEKKTRRKDKQEK